MNMPRILTTLGLAGLLLSSAFAAAHHGTTQRFENQDGNSCAVTVEYGHESDSTLTCTFPCVVGQRIEIYANLYGSDVPPTISGRAICQGFSVECEQDDGDQTFATCYEDGQPPVGLTGAPSAAVGVCTMETNSGYYSSFGMRCSSLGRRCDGPAPCRPPIVILPPDVEDVLDDIIQW